MKATGSKAEVLTNLFGGATNNEGLGIFSLSFDWQYVSLSPMFYTKTLLLIIVDYVLPDIASTHLAGSLCLWLPGLLCRYARDLLHKCVGLQRSSLHVNATLVPEWYKISH